MTRKIANVEISHRERIAGTSNYSIKKKIKLKKIINIIKKKIYK